MIHAYNEELYKELQKLINIPNPDSVRKLVITMEVDNHVQVELGMYAEKGTGEALTKSFRLIEASAVDITNIDSDEREFLLESGEIVTVPMLKSIRDTLNAYKNGKLQMVMKTKSEEDKREVVLVGEKDGYKEYRFKRDDE